MLAVKEREYAPGVYDISSEEYHASPGISKSGISQFRKAPKKYWDSYLNPNKPPEEDKKCFRIGKGIHTLLLEYQKFNFIPDPKMKKSKKADKQIWLDFKEANKDKKIISPDEYDLIVSGAEAISNHPEASKLIIKEAQKEKSFYWIDEESGLLCKCRPDMWHKNIVIELKTTDNASQSAFMRSIYKYDYYTQAAMQIDGVEINTGVKIDYFMFLAIETTRPFSIGVWQLDEAAIDHGRKIYKNNLLKMRECFDKNHWPDYTSGSDVKRISLPTYAFMEEI
jgi:hypothetical protein